MARRRCSPPPTRATPRSSGSVQVVGLKGRPELNGQAGVIGEFNEVKGRYPVRLESGEAVLIKMMNLVAIGDDV